MRTLGVVVAGYCAFLQLYATQPILPLLRHGEVFFGFGRTQYDDVTDGGMPGTPFIERLRTLTGASKPAAAPSATPATPAPELDATGAVLVSTINELLRPQPSSG